MKEENKNIGVINLRAYDAPVVMEDNSNDWVGWGENNDYFTKLIDRYIGSATNNRCISGISAQIYGRGLDATDSKEKPLEFAKMKLILKDKDVQRLVNDYKLLAQGVLKVRYNSTKTSIISIKHFESETIRMGKADSMGVIKKVYYSPDWSKVHSSSKPKVIPTFGNGRKNQLEEMYIIKPYVSGYYYYAPPDYVASMQYAELEEEVSNYHNRNIKNGLQPSIIVNFNNGVPNKDTQRYLEEKIYEKWGGTSNAGKAIISFNDSKDEETTIDPVHLPDAHAQYQFISDECRDKIMLGHGITSPILFGIKDNTGFGNNAEELRTASLIMDNIVIRHFQDQLIAALDEILAFNGIHLKLYFKTLQPIEFTDLDNVGTKIKREEETGEKLSALEDFTDEQGEDMLKQLRTLGEVVDESEWELIHTEVSSDDGEFNLEKFSKENRSVKDKILAFFSAYANPNEDSSQDNNTYKVRYAYMPNRKSADSRAFCRMMETDYTEKNIVFRREDISQMSFRGVNRELGHNQRNYSLFRYKGGKYCKHYWETRVYKRRVSESTEVSESSAVQDGFIPPNNPSEVEVRPADMPNGGAYPN